MGVTMKYTESQSLILAIDQGTSSTKTLLINEQGEVIAKETEPLETHYLEGSWVEQDPEAIYQNVLSSTRKCLTQFKSKGGDTRQIRTCGISNQRETFLLWDAKGKPLYPAIVWQCKRSVVLCNRLKAEGIEMKLKERTGLIIDPYFSGTKVMWLYENDAAIREVIDQGNAYFGNVDAWLLYKLTDGQTYLTDYTNASRTLFFNLKTLTWDRELLTGFGLSNLNLPELRPSSSHFGETDLAGLLDHPISISSMIGDSHAAAFGEGCFEPGDAKATLGTGCSILMNVGSEPKTSQNGMVATICWSAEGRVDYALEGIIVSAGATIEWVKNQLGLFESTGELEALCYSLEDNGGVYVVPGFSGLGAPHWDMSRKASIEGLTFHSTRDHLIRAAVESVPYQIKDVIGAMESDAGTPLNELKLDGGMTSNKFVVQFLADLLGRNVVTVEMADVSALGAGYLAGLQASIFGSIDELKNLHRELKYTNAGTNQTNVEGYYQGWVEMINKTK